MLSAGDMLDGNRCGWCGAPVVGHSVDEDAYCARQLRAWALVAEVAS